MAGACMHACCPGDTLPPKPTADTYIHQNKHHTGNNHHQTFVNQNRANSPDGSFSAAAALLLSARPNYCRMDDGRPPAARVGMKFVWALLAAALAVVSACITRLNPLTPSPLRRSLGRPEKRACARNGKEGAEGEWVGGCGIFLMA